MRGLSLTSHVMIYALTKQHYLEVGDGAEQTELWNT
jgi:hypothetical protein